MYQTIEVIYDKGRVFPLNEEIDIKRARGLLTILNNEGEDSKENKKKIFSNISKIFLEAKNHKIGKGINISKMDGEMNNDIF